ncbi:hypothetical protein [Blastopirellula retiformator]|uniref:Uncharacterized protein n=1 Tax=Blastopirellula retiformator TaxID=2527970 RepID=A0A5C5V8Z9_9BACT|nr:hypothetical protein [Blastopirellula retiformator]TWT34215.1 hypothetical protein Enr8_16090 [Blastopirellula retiformator]
MSKPVFKLTLVPLMLAAFFLCPALAVCDGVGSLTMAGQWTLNGETWMVMCHFSGDDNASDHLRSNAIILCKQGGSTNPNLICGAKRVQVTFDEKKGIRTLCFESPSLSSACRGGGGWNLGSRGERLIGPVGVADREE